MRWLVLLLLPSLAHAAPCTSTSTLDQVRADWGDAGTPTLTCRAIRAKPARILVEARIGADPTPVFAAIVEPGTDALLWTRQSIPGTPGDTNVISLVDLDGDGTDELIVHERHEGHMGSGFDTLYAFALRDTEVVEAGTLALGASGMDGGNGCTASWAIVGGRGNRPRVQIDGTRLADPKRTPASDGCPLDGVHRYRWTGAAFALAD